MKSYTNQLIRKAAFSIPPLEKLYQHRNHLLQQIEKYKQEIDDSRSTITSLTNELNYLKQQLHNATPQKSPILQDDFVIWIKAGVIGYCTDHNIEVIDHCISYLPAGAIIEIGSFSGLSTSIIAHALRRQSKTNPLFSVDDWYYEGYQLDTTISGAFTTDDWRAHMEDLFKLAMKLSIKGVKHSHIKECSDRFFKLWHEEATVVNINGEKTQLGGPIAFAYIDGNHSYEQAKKDFENIDKHLVSGGYVFFDDTGENVAFGCKDVAKEVASMPDYYLLPMCTEPNVNKCFKKK